MNIHGKLGCSEVCANRFGCSWRKMGATGCCEHQTIPEASFALLPLRCLSRARGVGDKQLGSRHGPCCARFPKARKPPPSKGSMVVLPERQLPTDAAQKRRSNSRGRKVHKPLQVYQRRFRAPIPNASPFTARPNRDWMEKLDLVVIRRPTHRKRKALGTAPSRPDELGSVRVGVVWK